MADPAAALAPGPLALPNVPFGVATPQEQGETAPTGLDNLITSFINQFAKLSMIPGQALQSEQPITTGEMIKPASDLALMTTLGSGAMASEADTLRMGIKAYHGSPHDFDAFDMSKIGTGEGAQAYGHGLYFAENEGVAQQYRDQLRWKGADFNDPQTIAQNALDRLGDREAAANSLESALNSTKAFYRGKVPAPQAAANEQSERAIALLRGNEPITGAPPTPGRMYEVNINADPEHFLDWDRPLSEQGENVKAFDDLYWNQYAKKNPDLRAFMQGPQGAEAMKSAGIPGIKYLDQGSRFQPQQVEHLQNQIAGLEDLLKQQPNDPSIIKALEGRKQELEATKPTYNYVVFDDRLINILKKYGITAVPWAAVFGGGQSAGEQKM